MPFWLRRVNGSTKGSVTKHPASFWPPWDANPGHADILRNLARVQLHRHEYLPALRTFDRLIGSGQADAADYTDTGDALTDIGEYAQAVDTYRRSLNLIA